jgi:DNA-binding response OmpR family regulator
MNPQMTILVVDDEPLVRNLVSRILKESGFLVIDAASGDQAIKALRDASCAPDLLLTDLKMPGMCGRDLADNAQAIWPELKVMFMSGYSDETCRTLGSSDEFVEKPFTSAGLVGKVRSVINRNARATDSHATFGRHSAAQSTNRDARMPSTPEHRGNAEQRLGATRPSAQPEQKTAEAPRDHAEETSLKLMRLEWELARKRLRRGA